MTYAELTTRMSAAEFDVWMVLQQLRAEECPNCGLDPRSVMQEGWTTDKRKCPACKHEYSGLIKIADKSDDKEDTDG